MNEKPKNKVDLREVAILPKNFKADTSTSSSVLLFSIMSTTKVTASEAKISSS